MERPSERSFASLDDLMVSNLNTAEQFVVGVTRCWDAFCGDPDPTLAWRELSPVFAYMNVLGALCAFDSVFRILKEHRLRTLTFNDVDSAPVGLAEARLLSALAALQRGNARTAGKALAGALTRAGVNGVLPPLARIAAILDAKRHRLPAWADGPPEYDVSRTLRPVARAETAWLRQSPAR